MRRAIKDKLADFRDDRRMSSPSPNDGQNNEKRQITDRVVGFVREKGNALATTVQEHVVSITDTTSTLAKQKLLHTLLSSGVIRSESIRHALQIGIGYFLAQPLNSFNTSANYIQRQKFPAVGGVTPPHSQPDFDLEAHGIETFDTLMHRFGINAQTLRSHICRGELKEIPNPASSGSLLYLTSDSAYLIKSVRDYEAKFIQQRFLQEYFQHIHQSPDTFLARLFGVFGYIPYLSKQRNITADTFALRFALFANFIPLNIEIHEKYDLKGSSYRRDANMSERLKSSVTFKDNDFRELHPTGFKLPAQTYRYIKEILERDVHFLEKLNIMDYSLLLIVHNIDNPVKAKRSGLLEAFRGCGFDQLLITMGQQRQQHGAGGYEPPSRQLFQLKNPTESLGFIYKEASTFDFDYAKAYGGIPAVNENGERVVLFLGIIDILQTFDICKMMQRQYQTVENRDVVAERSIVEPDFYARRFKEFMFERVFRPDETEPTTFRESMPIPFYPQEDFGNHHHRSTQSMMYPSLRS